MRGESTPEPPGPDGLPLLGTALDCFGDPMEFLGGLSEYGDVVRCGLPGVRAVALFHPADVERVLVTNHDAYRRWNFDELRAIAGNDVAPEGLAFNEGEQWRKQRRLLQPMFGLDRLRGYTDAMVEHAERMVERWDDGEEIVLNRAFSELSLAILTDSLFDLDVSERGDAVVRAAEALNDRARMEGTDTLSLLLPSWVPTPGANRYRAAMDAFDDLVADLIAERRADPGAHDDLLARMLDAESDEGYTLSESAVHDQLLTFLLAGHETTATALSFTWSCLATHPEKRDRLDTEIEAVLGDARPSPADLDDLVYTERVVREALRLYPPAAMLFREATEDATIGGYAIPEGTKLLLPQFVVHRDERWYDAPDAFRPERWADEGKEAERPDYAYFPFGGGPHHCIGMRFATLELQHVVPVVAQHAEFELLSDPDPDVLMEMTLQPAEDVRVRVHGR